VARRSLGERKSLEAPALCLHTLTGWRLLDSDSADVKRRKILGCVVVEENDDPSPGGRDDGVVNRRYPNDSSIRTVDREWNEGFLSKQSSDIRNHAGNLNHLMQQSKLFRTLGQNVILMAIRPG
jgi:hypothetical protein